MSGLQSFKSLINIQRLLEDEARIDLFDKSSYFISYPEFLTYFQNLNTLTRHNLIIASNFTYGWMPTILDLNPEKFDEVELLLNAAKTGQIPDSPQLEILSHCLNKSMVGASKLLHFINPASFAIWDSRVYRYITNTEPHHYRLNNPTSYLEYLKLCKELVELPAYDGIHDSMVRKVGYKMTKLRTVELVMYLSAGDQQIKSE